MKYLILGGTGTLGQELIKRLLESENAQITCFSRDELKQQTLKRQLGSARVRFAIGDIRDKDRLRQVMPGHDVVFHVAALKHVDVIEENPEESVKTNILGTMNTADVAIESGVENFIFSSTDKAVDPINVYGMSKGISEKILLAKNAQGATRFAVYRWGNVIGSRGSALNYFIDALKAGQTVNVTNLAMTRFWIKIEDAVSFMLDTYATAPHDRVLVPPIQSAGVTDVIQALADLLGVSYTRSVSGIRPGEKLHEVLRSVHEDGFMTSACGNTFTQAELKKFLAPFVLGTERDGTQNGTYRHSSEKRIKKTGAKVGTSYLRKAAPETCS